MPCSHETPRSKRLSCPDMPTDHSQELAALKDALEAARAYL